MLSNISILKMTVGISRLLDFAKNGFSVLFFRGRQSWFLLIYLVCSFASFGLMFSIMYVSYIYLRLKEFLISVSVDNWFASFFCFDAISIGLVFITVTIFPWCFVYVIARADRHLWAIYLLFTEILVLLAFISIDLLFFFVMFELLIFPIYKIILGWGSKGDLRLTAARSFIMYTVLGSILLLFVIIYLYSVFGTTNIFLLKQYNWYLPDFLLFVMFIAFATKVPTFPFYHWLTLAHVEASTVGSVILAALILKLGSYGFVRFLMPLYCEHLAFHLWCHVAISLFIVSILFASLSAVVQTDMKRIVAYSSIEHMNLAIIGLALCSTTSVMGSYIIMLAHGWVAAGLFFAVGWIYDLRHQRDVLYYRGYAIIDGWWSIFFGLLLLANIGFPLTLNFFGEIQILIDLFGTHTELLGLIFFVIMANVTYTLKLGLIMWGEPYSYLLITSNSNVKNVVLRCFRVLRLICLLAVPLFFILLSGHPEYYPEINVLFMHAFDFWHIVFTQTKWPWALTRWI